MKSPRTLKKALEKNRLGFGLCKGAIAVLQPFSRLRWAISRACGYRLAKIRELKDIWLFLGFNILDCITTWIAFNLGGEEGNPFFLWLGIDEILEIIFFKMFIVFFGCLMFRNHTQILRYAGYGLAFVCCVNVFAIIDLI